MRNIWREFGQARDYLYINTDMKTLGENPAFAYLGGGCFWCLEAVFKERHGVVSVVSGYAGGHSDKPTYEAVCRGDTGHAEMVRIAYDPERMSYAALLEVFFHAHDPTTLNQQGADVGTQYRSIILYTSEEERLTARQAMEEAASAYGRQVVTELKPLAAFHEAEEYHQDYYRKNPHQGYCRAVIRPKMIKLGFE